MDCLGRVDRVDYGVDGRALLLMPIGYCLFPDEIGALAQLGEHLLCKQGVNGSIPLSSTIFGPHGERSLWLLPADGAPNGRRRPHGLYWWSAHD